MYIPRLPPPVPFQKCKCVRISTSTPVTYEVPHDDCSEILHWFWTYIYIYIKPLDMYCAACIVVRSGFDGAMEREDIDVVVMMSTVGGGAMYI